MFFCFNYFHINVTILSKKKTNFNRAAIDQIDSGGGGGGEGLLNYHHQHYKLLLWLVIFFPKRYLIVFCCCCCRYCSICQTHNTDHRLYTSALVSRQKFRLFYYSRVCVSVIMMWSDDNQKKLFVRGTGFIKWIELKL